MKKIWMGLAAVVLVMTLGVTGALAAGRHGQGLRYTDTDGDGVCDYYGTNCGAGFADSDGDGVCDYYGTGCGTGFVDADGDGVCDYHGTGWGAGFVDADGDGVCDHYGTGVGCHHGGGHGGCWNR